MAPQTLYKCIPFSAPYWDYIATEQNIRFATIPELWKGNDREEFDHRWDTNSQFFKKFIAEMEPRYDALFSKTVILSMGKSPKKKCWDEYCRVGGVRYEFGFDIARCKTTDVVPRDVVYDDAKTYNLPNYLTRLEPNLGIKRLLEVESGLTWINWYYLWRWLQSGTPNHNSLAHIVDELAFKKTTSFIYEDEFRFVHLTQKIGPNPLKIVLQDQKTPFSDIGLKLLRITTSDVKQVKDKVQNEDIDVSEVYFE